ncbi:MAG: FIST C-terminal domain-containing protein [Rhodomicrobium sp.]|nr:FIST C-terminal domain-containing protein [Rhodomicrobium sp.]
MVSNATTRCALATGSDAGQIVNAAAEMLAARGTGGTLGFVYATDTLKTRLPDAVQRLRELTGVEDWAGTIGFGVMGGRKAAFDEPAIAVMITYWPKEEYKLFQGVPQEPWSPPSARGPLGGMPTALVHADPRNPQYHELLQSLSNTCGAYPMGGVTASRSRYQGQIAGQAVEGGISGVLAGPGIGATIGVSQGCSAAGPVRTITAGERNIITGLDGAPPLDALFQDLNVARPDDVDALYAALETLHVALLVPNCDTGDYLVRNFVGIDTDSGIIAIGDRAEPGQKLFFARRNREAAAKDLQAMARKACGRAPKLNGALYVSCCGRGPHLFTSAEEEIGLIQDVLGDVPLAGFYANGEIAGDRIYGYTGVLALF